MIRLLSSSIDGSLRGPVILIGIALPPPGCLRNGSTTFSSSHLNAGGVGAGLRHRAGERDGPAVHAVNAYDASFGDHLRVAKRRVHALEPRVAVGAVDERVIHGVERDGMTGLGYRECRRLGLSADVDF